MLYILFCEKTDVCALLVYFLCEGEAVSLLCFSKYFCLYFCLGFRLSKFSDTMLAVLSIRLLKLFHSEMALLIVF